MIKIIATIGIIITKSVLQVLGALIISITLMALLGMLLGKTQYKSIDKDIEVVTNATDKAQETLDTVKKLNISIEEVISKIDIVCEDLGVDLKNYKGEST